MFKVLGHRVLIDPAFPEETTDWGFKLDVGDTHKLERGATTEGTVVGIGSTAWSDPGLGGEPWCKVGDRVYFAKYAGRTIKDGDKEYIIINDEDCQVVIVEESSK